jgi:hypothetical protein
VIRVSDVTTDKTASGIKKESTLLDKSDKKTTHLHNTAIKPRDGERDPS